MDLRKCNLSLLTFQWKKIQTFKWNGRAYTCKLNFSTHRNKVCKFGDFSCNGQISSIEPNFGLDSFQRPRHLWVKRCCLKCNIALFSRPGPALFLPSFTWKPFSLNRINQKFSMIYDFGCTISYWPIWTWRIEYILFMDAQFLRFSFSFIRPNNAICALVNQINLKSWWENHSNANGFLLCNLSVCLWLFINAKSYYRNATLFLFFPFIKCTKFQNFLTSFFAHFLCACGICFLLPIFKYIAQAELAKLYRFVFYTDRLADNFIPIQSNPISYEQQTNNSPRCFAFVFIHVRC